MLRAIVSACVIACTCLGQPSPVFEVASVRQNKSGDLRGLSWRFQPGRFTARNLPVYIIVATAYSIPMYSKRLSGPNWIYSEKYDIDAKTSDPIPPDAGRAMLRSLPADRFELTVRRETKEMPVYAAVVTRSGLQLARSKIDVSDCPEGGPNYGGSCQQCCRRDGQRHPRRSGFN